MPVTRATRVGARTTRAPPIAKLSPCAAGGRAAANGARAASYARATAGVEPQPADRAAARVRPQRRGVRESSRRRARRSRRSRARRRRRRTRRSGERDDAHGPSHSTTYSRQKRPHTVPPSSPVRTCGASLARSSVKVPACANVRRPSARPARARRATRSPSARASARARGRVARASPVCAAQYSRRSSAATHAAGGACAARARDGRRARRGRRRATRRARRRRARRRRNRAVRRTPRGRARPPERVLVAVDRVRRVARARRALARADRRGRGAQSAWPWSTEAVGASSRGAKCASQRAVRSPPPSGAMRTTRCSRSSTGSRTRGESMCGAFSAASARGEKRVGQLHRAVELAARLRDHREHLASGRVRPALEVRVEVPRDLVDGAPVERRRVREQQQRCERSSPHGERRPLELVAAERDAVLSPLLIRNAPSRDGPWCTLVPAHERAQRPTRRCRGKTRWRTSSRSWPTSRAGSPPEEGLPRQDGRARAATRSSTPDPRSPASSRRARPASSAATSARR